jgi:selenocysteine lyase/cysteine desulfurase
MAQKVKPPQKIYLDNSSTSFPKPPGLAEAVSEYIRDVGCNLDRSGYGTTCTLNKMARESRTLLAELFNYPNFRHVILTPSITVALNIVIKGLLRPGDHALISGMEHNAVTRPLFQLGRGRCG